MRRKVLVVSLATGWLTLWSQPTFGATSAVQTTTTVAGSQQGCDFPAEPTWLREMLLDRLTIPLGLADRQDCWPFGVGGLPLSPRYD
jgi:hypothetical protein